MVKNFSHDSTWVLFVSLQYIEPILHQSFCLSLSLIIQHMHILPTSIFHVQTIQSSFFFDFQCFRCFFLFSFLRNIPSYNSKNLNFMTDHIEITSLNHLTFSILPLRLVCADQNPPTYKVQSDFQEKRRLRKGNVCPDLIGCLLLCCLNLVS